MIHCPPYNLSKRDSDYTDKPFVGARRSYGASARFTLQWTQKYFLPLMPARTDIRAEKIHFKITP